jgi:hypothetical protein
MPVRFNSAQAAGVYRSLRRGGAKVARGLQQLGDRYRYYKAARRFHKAPAGFYAGFRGGRRKRFLVHHLRRRSV